jgi:hypothetical protein
MEDELRFGRKGEAEVVIGGTTGFDVPAAEVAGVARPALLAADGEVRTGAAGAVEAARTFRLSTDRYLEDHRIDGRPIVPFAVATELMAEVAGAANGAGVAELADIRLLAGMDVDDDGFGVVVTAAPAAEGLDVAIAASADPRRLRYRARAVLGAPSVPDPSPEPLTTLAPFPMSVGDAYRDLLFHGPLFQGIQSIEGIDERGLRAVLSAAEPAGVLTGADGAQWWFDPIVFDCALQLQVIWARLHWDITLLPSRLGRARAIAPFEGPVHYELRIRPESRAPSCHADHYFSSPEGRLLAVLEDAVGTGSKALNRLAGARATA